MLNKEKACQWGCGKGSTNDCDFGNSGYATSSSN